MQAIRWNKIMSPKVALQGIWLLAVILVALNTLFPYTAFAFSQNTNIPSARSEENMQSTTNIAQNITDTNTAALNGSIVDTTIFNETNREASGFETNFLIPTDSQNNTQQSSIYSEVKSNATETVIVPSKNNESGLSENSIQESGLVEIKNHSDIKIICNTNSSKPSRDVINSSYNITTCNETLENKTSVLPNEINETIKELLGNESYFFWDRKIVNKHNGKKEIVNLKLKVPETLRSITKEIDALEKNALIKIREFDYNNEGIKGDIPEDKIKLAVLEEKIKEAINNRYEIVEFYPNLNSVKKIEFYDLIIEGGQISLGIEDLNKEGYVQSYAIDPTGLNFTKANVIVVAKGTELWKCKEWNFSEQVCHGDWVKIMDLSPGQEYTLTLTPEDPSFAETNYFPNGTHRAWFFEDNSIPSSQVPPFGTEYTSAEYTAVQASDNSYATFSAVTEGFHEVTQYEFIPSQSFTSINNFTITWEGFSTLISSGKGVNLYLRNFTGNSWFLATSTTNTSEQTLSYTTSNKANFVNPSNNKIWVMVESRGVVPLSHPISCPYLYIRTDNDYAKENDIFPYAIGNENKKTNYLVLNNRPTENDGEYYLKISEEKEETSYIDSVKLYAVEHPKDVKIAIDSEGNIYTYKNFKIYLSNRTYQDEQLQITFDDVKSSTARLLISSAVIPVKKDVIEYPAISIGEKYTYVPQETSDIKAFDISEYIKDGKINLTIQLVGKHRIDLLALDTSEQAKIKVRKLRPVATYLSKEKALIFEDGKYAVINKGESVELAYEKSNEIEERSFVVAVKGYYVPKKDVVEKILHELNKSSYIHKNRTMYVDFVRLTVQYTNFEPTITLFSPLNNTQFNNTQTVKFNFSAIDDLNKTLSCGIYLDNILNQTNSTTQNNTVTEFTIGGISFGSHTWFINCTDGSASNISEIRKFIIADAQAPGWSNNKNFPSSPATYSQTQTYQFNITWTDNTGLSTVLFEHNFTGVAANFSPTGFTGNTTNREYFYNYGPLAAGNYYWKSHANDTSGNTNSTATFLYTVNKATPTLNITLQPSSSVTYGTTTNASCTASTPQITPQLFRNETLVSNPDVGILAAGSYNYTCTATETQNYTAPTPQQAILTINKAATLTELRLNGNRANLTVTYPTPVNATANTSALIVNLYRNGILIASGNPATNTSVLAAGSYNYTAVNPGNQNYSSSFETWFATINQNTTTCNLAFNPPSPQTYPTAINASCSCTNPETKPSLFRNNTNVTATENNAFVTLPAGVWNYNCTSPQTQNYTYAENTSTYTVNKATPTLNITLQPSSTTTYGTTTNASCTASTPQVIPQLFRNGTLVSNPDINVLAAGSYNYTCTATETQNYTAPTPQQAILTINKATSEVNLLLNGNDANTTATQFSIVNITAKLITPTSGLIDLFENGTLLSSGSSPLEVLKNYTTIGTYNITAVFNSTQNYTSSFETHFITITTAPDTTPPSVFDPKPAPNSAFNTGTTIEIAVNATDDFAIDTVYANITLPNGTQQQLSLAPATGSKYNNSFTIPTLTGLYNITYFANDTSGNTNTTTTTNFTATTPPDTTPPSVFDPKPAPNSAFNTSTTIEIAANATDDFAIDTVYANITLPNGTQQQLSLALAVGNKYNNTYIIPALTGLYNITYFANDTSGNTNTTTTTNFTATTPPDTTPPSVFDPKPAPNSAFNTSTTIEIAANATDDFAIDTVYANITLPNGTQ
ncbi:MAG: hypothetical protein QW308_03365, partial [Candidatus Woesearchaeota archaeon]